MEAEYKIWIPNPMKHRGRVFEVSKTTLDKETGRGGRAGVAQSATLDATNPSEGARTVRDANTVNSSGIIIVPGRQ